MQLQDSTLLEISSHTDPDMAVVTVPPPDEAAGDNNDGDGGDIIGVDIDANSGEGNNEEGNNKMSFGGNRWPRQETLALLKIRSDMDAVFRDSTPKGPLWEEVSRKMAGLGYDRSAKKCKEKFENVYKYNKRTTKENKSGKSQGKTYKFFDQLQALENQFSISYPSKSQATTLATTIPSDDHDGNNKGISYVTPFTSTNPTLISPSPQTNTTTTTSTTNPNPSTPQTNNNNNNVPHSLPNMNAPFSTSTSTSSSTASDEDLEERYRRKRKWKDYFRRLTRKVLLKQEEMQRKFLEAMDKRERERMAQQDNWRMQEMARINREHEILVQERSTSVAKDTAVIALLQKLYGQQNPTQVDPPQHMQTMPQTQSPILMPNNNLEIKKMNNGHSATSTTTITTASASAAIATATTTTAVTTTSPANSSSRWPKAEVHALIRLRTSLETKYQENGPKAPLWEDISIAMQRLGYNRNAKRCKEKWENINKYFKKVRESNKERREDSKTCPYFHELEALYKEKRKSHNPFGMNMKTSDMMMMEPLMVQPEQQWRPPPQSLEEGIGKENASEEEYQEKEEEEENGDDDNEDGVEDDGDSVEDEGENRCEIATNN